MSSLLVAMTISILGNSSPSTDLIVSATIRSLQDRSPTIAVQPDPSISDDELNQIKLGFSRLSQIRIRPDSQFILGLSRVSPKAVQAQLRSPNDTVVFIGQFQWPVSSSSFPSEVTESQKYAKVLEFKREKLELRPFIQSQFVSRTLIVGGPSWRRDSRWHAGIFHGPRVESRVSEDWGIYQGPIRRLTELEFAEIINDSELIETVTQTTQDLQFKWRLGFGVASGLSFAAGSLFLAPIIQDKTSSAASLTPGRRSSYEALAGGLITTGIVTLIAAMMPPKWSKRILNPRQAQLRCDLYNEELRKQLELSPADLQKWE